MRSGSEAEVKGATGSLTFLSRSSKETQKWGTRVGTFLRGGEIIGLSGELGSGKTCFARGVAEGLEVEKSAWLRSPTFTLINEYHGRVPIYHIDLYRISEPRQIEELNLRDYLYSGGVAVIEWFERLPATELGDHLKVLLEHVTKNRRRLVLEAHGMLYERILDGLGAGARGDQGS